MNKFGIPYTHRRKVVWRVTEPEALAYRDITSLIELRRSLEIMVPHSYFSKMIETYFRSQHV